MTLETALSQELPPGTRLEEFIIERVLGSGGFGITYLARDKRLGRKVVIKENLPAQFCWRDSTSLTVQPRKSSGEDADNFQYSLESFEKEAATLASLDHPGIVKVLRSFEANGTAYFVMPFVEGMTFDEVMREREMQHRPFMEEELIALLHKVLAALGYLHERGIYHRDIKPGNLLIPAKGDPVLIDFGAARQRLSERSLTVIESPGYTPFEQMQSRGKVGPWSDLYALGGTLYKAMTGWTPAKAADRILEDDVVPLAQRRELVAHFSQQLLQSIDRAMRPKLSERPQSAEEWIRSLQGSPFQLLGSPFQLSAERSVPSAIPTEAAGSAVDIFANTNKTAPFKNTLGMAFVPAGTPGVLFSVWHTRVKDFAAFVQETGHDAISDSPFGKPAYTHLTLEKTADVGWARKRRSWKDPRFPTQQTGEHPVVCVSYLDAEAFCAWMSTRDRAAGVIPQTASYRLPTDNEWSQAVGGSEFPSPWGENAPPISEDVKNGGKEAKWRVVEKLMRGLTEGTAPVGMFKENRFGLYDMGDNVFEWSSTWYTGDLNDAKSKEAIPSLEDDKGGQTYRVLLGDRVGLRSSWRGKDLPRRRTAKLGFRCVLVVAGC
jgi:serine/threonine protein kinase/formylglycine-generating enzyme required for sulfatase activity